MDLNNKHRVERAKWDQQADSSRENLRVRADDDFYQYIQRSSMMRGVEQFLGNLEGKLVLEYGCGLGEVNVLLARTGARVTSFDLSEKCLQVTRQRFKENNVNTDLAVAAGENLPFASDYFDVIFGRAILHHLDPELGAPDLYRILKSGGKAAFVEPLGMNPVLKFVREYVPYTHKSVRGADHPLNYNEIAAWGSQFHQLHYQEIQLLSMLERGLGFGKCIPVLHRLDGFLLKRVPNLRRYCRYVVMLMEK